MKQLKKIKNKKFKQEKISLIQVGEKNNILAEKVKEDLNEVGIEVFWYYFDEKDDLVFEMALIAEDGSYCILDDSWVTEGLYYIVKDIGGTIVSDKMLDYGGDLIISKEINKFSHYADLVVTFNGCNCYSIYGPILDLNDKCINCENREVIGSEELYRIGVLSRFISED